MRHEQAAAAPADRFVGERERREITGVPRQTWWRMERAGQAPGRLQVTPGRVGWRLSELLRWMDERPRVASRNPKCDAAAEPRSLLRGA
jgi:prophage regulatory protein